MSVSEDVFARPLGLLPSRFHAILRDGARYFLVSAVALVIDYETLVVGHRLLGWHYLAAAAAGFMAGLVVAYSLSVVFVFTNRRRLSPMAEFLGFLATGLAGLAVNQAAMALLVSGFALAPEAAKIPVACCVFVFNFLSRRLLFTATELAA